MRNVPRCRSAGLETSAATEDGDGAGTGRCDEGAGGQAPPHRGHGAPSRPRAQVTADDDDDDDAASHRRVGVTRQKKPRFASRAVIGKCV